jgi:hypothetical protein
MLCFMLLLWLLFEGPSFRLHIAGRMAVPFCRLPERQRARGAANREG